jgi:hypothetical protein
MLTGKNLDGQEKLDASTEKLRKSCISKMRTIMIGAISDIETDASFDELRKSILDRGNDLIRAFEEELKQYNIEFKGNLTVFRKG